MKILRFHQFGTMKPLGSVFAGLALLALAASGWVRAEVLDRPPKPDWQTVASQCIWHWREGGRLGLWTETCELPTGQWQVVWDDQAHAFVLQHNSTVQAVVVQSWPLPSAPTASPHITALTRVLIDAGHLAPDADCVWKPMPRRAPRTMAFFVLSPSAPEAMSPTAQGEIPDPLCGPFGASTHGVKYFIHDLRWADRAIFVNEGQERPLFDPGSITVLP